jgi:chorismate dehydratase
MAAPESPEELAQRHAREQHSRQLHQQDALEEDSRAFRIGSVPHLNAVPLTRGIEAQTQFLPPSRLAALLAADELDAALISVTEVLFHDRYDVLDGIAIASLGEVKSVLLAHRLPLEQIREVHCDPASLTSVHLLRVLLAERGLQPTLRPLASYEDAHQPDAVLLIGDAALDFQFAPLDHTVWDLGAAWNELTGLPFVYAVWALRRDPALRPLRRLLCEARTFGLDTLEQIIAERTKFNPGFLRDYLGWHIHFHLGTDERRGIRRFMELLAKHGAPRLHEPRYVGLLEQ